MKERLDILLVKRGLAPSREKAKTMIKKDSLFKTAVQQIETKLGIQ